MWLIIEFAKLQKTENIELYGGAFSIENLIQLGIQVLYREKHENLDTEKEVQYNYTKYIWDMLLQKKTLDRYYIIYKDATASAIQLLTTYLGPINTEIAIHANLMSETH